MLSITVGGRLPHYAERGVNGGHYDERQVLKPEFGNGQSGLRLHLLQPNEVTDQRPFSKKLKTHDNSKSYNNSIKSL